MSLPPINPDKTAAGIALDPRTLERVIPESRRPDGRYVLNFATLVMYPYLTICFTRCIPYLGLHCNG